MARGNWRNWNEREGRDYKSSRMMKSQINDYETSYTCSECGYVHKTKLKNVKFCPKCGNKFKE